MGRIDELQQEIVDDFELMGDGFGQLFLSDRAFGDIDSPS